LGSSDLSALVMVLAQWPHVMSGTLNWTMRSP
jgi:hypothetical protein